jgi:hypothetical protein
MAYLGNIPIVLPVDGSELADGTITNAKLATGITSSKMLFDTTIIPSTNDSIDIGSAEYKVRDMYISEDSLWIGDDHKVSITGGKMKFKKRKKTSVPTLITAAGGNEGAALAHAGRGSLAQMTTHDWLGYGRTMNAAAKMEDIFHAENDFDSENKSGVTAGVYGSTSAIPIITVDEDGKVTTVTTVAPVTQTDENFTTADHTKLDGIETSATADQTAAQIKTHLENGIDSVHYVDGSIDNVHLATGIDATKLTGTIAAARLSSATTQAANNNSTLIATTAYVQTELTDLIGGAPGTLATLNELAAAINDDASYSSTLTTAIATKMPLAGGAFTGAVTTNSTFDGVDIATRDGVLTSTTNTANAALPKAGGTMTGHTTHGDNVYSKWGASNDLEIYHSGTASFIKENGTGELYIRGTNIILKSGADNDDYIKCHENGDVILYYSNSQKLATTTSGISVTGNVVVSGEVHSASDIALKENIEPITNAINKLKEISGVTFNMIGEKIRSTGIIAQDVEKVLPEAVANGEFKSVAYGSMVGLLIEAIKEQQTQIDDLKQEIQNGK